MQDIFMISKANWVIVDLETGQYEHNFFSCILQLGKYTHVSACHSEGSISRLAQGTKFH